VLPIAFTSSSAAFRLNPASQQRMMHLHNSCYHALCAGGDAVSLYWWQLPVIAASNLNTSLSASDCTHPLSLLDNLYLTVHSFLLLLLLVLLVLLQVIDQSEELAALGLPVGFGKQQVRQEGKT
jgi:hypothetical protein